MCDYNGKTMIKSDAIQSIMKTNSIKSLNIIKDNDNYSIKKSTSTQNLIARNSIESLETNFSKKMTFNLTGNTLSTTITKIQKSNEKLSNNNLDEFLIDSFNEITANKKDNEKNTEIKFEIKTKSLINLISANLVDTIIFNQENSFRYDFESIFYDKYFQNFSSNYHKSEIKNKTNEDENNKTYKEQVTNILSKHIYNVIKKLESEISTIIIAMIYLKRILIKQSLYLSLETVLNVFNMLLVLAHKYIEDVNYSDKAMAKIINIPISSINKMELML